VFVKGEEEFEEGHGRNGRKFNKPMVPHFLDLSLFASAVWGMEKGSRADDWERN
jgi:hypothetical protein